MGIYDVPRFWVQTGACAVSVYLALSPPPLKEGPGDEARAIAIHSLARDTVCHKEVSINSFFTFV